MVVDDDLLELTWALPVSKNDPSGRGTVRTWGCLCSVSGLPCPYHLAKSHHLWLTSLPRSSAGDLDGMPLFPGLLGAVVKKEAMVRTSRPLLCVVASSCLLLLGLAASEDTLLE